MSKTQTQLPLTSDDIEALQAAGYAVVPLVPTDEMRSVGAPLCYQAYDGDWATARSDAAECYQAMIESGRLR